MVISQPNIDVFCSNLVHFKAHSTNPIPNLRLIRFRLPGRESVRFGLTGNQTPPSAVGRWFRLQTSPLPFAEVKYEHGEAVVILKYDVAKTSRFLGVGLAVIF